jgi:hypothetical protein
LQPFDRLGRGLGQLGLCVGPFGRRQPFLQRPPQEPLRLGRVATQQDVGAEQEGRRFVFAQRRGAGQRRAFGQVTRGVVEGQEGPHLEKAQGHGVAIPVGRQGLVGRGDGLAPVAVLVGGLDLLC